MATEGLLHFWHEWAIQILVLLSFTLQVFLLVFAGARRRSSSAVLRAALWLAYLLADSTAVFTLGHISVFFVVAGSRSGKHQLAAFWAPFLLLHLGGQDTISAYALEDNSLWLRHLIQLVVQALGAAYVLYMYMADSGASLLLASVAVFVAGLVKYGERIWALRCGTMSSIRSSLEYDIEGCLEYCNDEFCTVDDDETEEETLRRAYCKLNLCKAILTGEDLQAYSSAFSFGGSITVEAKYKVVEMQLSLMYDILYTKAAVIHTWYGFGIRFISLLGTAAAFLLFQLSRRDGYSRGRDGYSRVDVIVSYVLLVGASVLEAMSCCRALLSSRTCESMRRRSWDRASRVITSLRRLVQPARRRLWSCSIGQLNVLHLGTCDSSTCSGTFSPTRDLKELVFQELQQETFKQIRDHKSRGRATLERMGAYKRYARWSVSNDLSFDESIFVWHVATDFYIQESKAELESRNPSLIEATRVISNYMVFLVVRKPDLLPGHLHHGLYLYMCKWLRRRGISATASPRSQNPYRKLKDLFNHKGPDHSSIPQRAMVAEVFENLQEEWGERYRREGDGDVHVGDGMRGFGDRCAWVLAQELLDLGRPDDTLELIFGVWVEMMLYAAEYCSRESHTKQLSNGGEFITIMWFLAYYSKWTNEWKSIHQGFLKLPEQWQRVHDHRVASGIPQHVDQPLEIVCGVAETPCATAKALSWSGPGREDVISPRFSPIVRRFSGPL